MNYSTSASPDANSKWYKSLNQSPLTPPSWVFPIAWTILYTLIIASGVVFSVAHHDHSRRGPFSWILLLLRGVGPKSLVVPDILSIPASRHKFCRDFSNVGIHRA